MLQCCTNGKLYCRTARQERNRRNVMYCWCRGNVKKLVKTALSGRKIITIDGCPLACSRACLSNHSINADGHFELTALGVKKRDHEDFDLEQARDILRGIQKKVRELEGVASTTDQYEKV
nr:putative zinc-binding protein [Candidatus Brachybacter algidus]